MAKYPRSVRKQFQLQRKGNSWLVYGFHRGIWRVLAEADSRKNAKELIKHQTEYYKFFLEYQRRSGSR